jgi:hypothetical protein
MQQRLHAIILGKGKQLLPIHGLHQELAQVCIFFFTGSERTRGQQYGPLAVVRRIAGGHSVCCSRENGGRKIAQAVAPDSAGRTWICTRFAAACLLASMFADGTPVRANDFSQSCDEGPRMLPS